MNIPVVNSLLKTILDNAEVLIERVLWVGNNTIVVIDIHSPDALPVVMNYEEVTGRISSGVTKTTEEDPFLKAVPADSIGEKAEIIRDKSWKLIEKAAAFEPDIYYSEERGRLVNEIVSDTGVQKKYIYKYLRRYWQRGKNINALLPDYWKSGGRGKEKKTGEKKIGRPRKINVNGSGINIDEATKRIFRLSVINFYNNSKRNPLTTAYDLMIRKFYTNETPSEDGVGKLLIHELSAIPTFTQFKYWFNKEQDYRKSVSSRMGAKKYELQHRPVLGKSDAGFIGPGSKYQIDATVGDIYLVSSLNAGWIIGRPVVYAVIDVFSRMVAGIYVGLEGPSWIGAMMALANSACDKTAFCAEYGIKISDADWPCRHIPESILGDRGEMEGRYVNSLINTLHVRIENTPPYRADWKGIIEQYFRTLNIKVKPFAPGFIDKDFRERGAEDYRLNARLTIRQFTEIIIKCVLYHNNHSWMDKYALDSPLLADGANPVPLELWNWGIVNRSGKLRNMPEDIVKLSLMPAATATVTERGIKFKNMYYKSDRSISEHWFERARRKGSWKVDISYDKRLMDYIYVRPEDSRDYDICRMIDGRGYTGKTAEEIDYLEEYQKMNRLNNEDKIMQSKVDLIAGIEEITKTAVKNTDRQKLPGISKTARLKGIRENRAKEKQFNRGSESFILDEDTKGPKPVNIEPGIENGDYKDNIIDVDYASKMQKERLRKNED